MSSAIRSILSFVYVPRGTVHSFGNVGTTPGRLLIMSTPAGGTERFFFEVGEPAAEGSSPPTSLVETEGLEGIARLKKIAQKHGFDIDTLALLQQLSAGPTSEKRGKDDEQPGGHAAAHR